MLDSGRTPLERGQERTALGALDRGAPRCDKRVGVQEQLPSLALRRFPDIFKLRGRSKANSRPIRGISNRRTLQLDLTHQLRDSFAVGLLQNGVSLETVSVLLGNSIKVCERHYNPWVKSRQHNLAREIERAWKLTGSEFPKRRTSISA